MQIAYSPFKKESFLKKTIFTYILCIKEYENSTYGFVFHQFKLSYIKTHVPINKLVYRVDH